MDKEFFRSNKQPKELPSLFPFEKTFNKKFRFLRGSVTGKKNLDQNHRIQRTENDGSTEPSFAINSKFESLVKSGRKNFKNNRTSIFSRQFDFQSKKDFFNSKLGKRSSIDFGIKNMRSSTKQTLSKNKEKEKIKTLTRKIIRSYKFNVQMAMNVFKKVCFINEPECSKKASSKPNIAKSFILKLNNEDQENVSLDQENETKTMKNLFSKTNVVAPPNTGIRKISVSQSCRESRLWTKLLEKINNDSNKKKKRKRRKVSSGETFTFHKMEKKQNDSKKIVDINGKFEFLDLSFKNINKDQDHNN
jgi:hypothetical protein